MSSIELDVKDFRRALAQFPTGVTVITTRDEKGEPIGVTASSFNSVSMDPPLILWSIDKGAYSLSTFKEAEHFAVNVLSRDQVDVSNRFASRGEDKFSGIEFNDGIGGSPILDDYAAQFECKTWAVYEGGDHIILVGEVLDYRYKDMNEPLVFARGSYAVSASHPAMVKPSEGESSGEFVSDYLLYLLRETYNRYSQELYPKMQKACGVTPEEWRVMAVLEGSQQLSISALAPLVMQPESALRETVEWMIEKGRLESVSADAVALSESGKVEAAELLNIAKTHEANALAALPGDQADLLKDSLRTIMAAQS